MEFVCYTAWDQLPSSADPLFGRGEKRSLFLSRSWFEGLTAHALDDGERLLLACVTDRGRILAALPLRANDHGSWHALGGCHTSLFSVLLADEGAQGIVECLAEGLRGLPWQSLRLEPVDDDDPAVGRLQLAMANLGIESQRLFYFVNWSHQLRDQSFERYFADRPSRLRNTVARKRRKLKREHGYEIRLYKDRHLDRALADYARVYQASWKDGERFRDFVPALARTTAVTGWLRLGILYIEREPAAAQIWFVLHGKASIFRLAYDERWQWYSPGSILTTSLMEQVIDRDGVESIDFLTGNERYKQDWMSERRELWRLVFIKEAESITRLGTLDRLRKWLG